MKYILLLVMVLTLNILPQEILKKQIELTGNLSADSKILDEKMPLQKQQMQVPTGKKSPVLAGLLSLVIPGAGEVYAESYIKAAVFVALEAAVITTAVIYDKKGDKQTEDFEAYADKNWSVVDYARWLIQYENGNPGIVTSDNTNLKPWERVNWALLNSSETGSHKLPPHGEQQYYEMIGKYYQFASGWNDYSGGANNTLLSPNFTYYSGLRGDANDYYNVATKAVVVLYINHFLSALDAAWSAVSFNKDLQVSMKVEDLSFVGRNEFMPYVNFTYHF